MTTVLKLGGSVVTEKHGRETLDEDALDRAAAAIGEAVGDPNHEADGSTGDDTGGSTDDDPAGAGNDGPAGSTGAETGGSGSAERLVLVHGGGSFGHHHAADRGVTASEGTHDARDVLAIHDAMGRLNAAVVERLHDHDVPALPVRPLSVASRSADGTLDLPTRQVATMLDEGFCPVLHGDGVVQRGAGVTILGGDDLVVALAASLSADRVGLCSTVPGVLDGDGEVVPRVERFADVEAAVGGSDATDVTGGMAAKVRALLDLSVPAHVFGPGDLPAFLAGDSPGTLVDAGGNDDAGRGSPGQ